MPTEEFYTGQSNYIRKLNDLWDRATTSVFGTSTDSLSVTTGSKTFTTNTNLQFAAGSQVIITATADLSKYMSGQVTAYDQGTGAIVVNVTSVVGSGTFSSWSITLSGATGATGAAGIADNLSIGTVTSGAAAASITGTSPNKFLNLTLQTGATGAAGAPNVLSIGTVTGGATASATITGTSPAQVLNLVLPKGDTGDTGATGATGLTARGAWNASTAYVTSPSVDWVTYAGSSYYRKVAGTTPTDPATDTTNWGVLALKGANGAGSVSSVTASAPLASSGGATPNITITQANGSTNGFLSSTDWNTFNGKLSGSYVPTWASVTGKPTTIAGYGITDALVLTELAPLANAAAATVGVATVAARGDHVHIFPTALQSGASIPGALQSVGNSLTAVGTNQATALALTNDINFVTTVAVGTGVVVQGATAGKTVIIMNRGANPLAVYPSPTHFFDAFGANTPVSIPVGGLLEIFGTSAAQWSTTLNASINGSAVIGAVAEATTATNATNATQLGGIAAANYAQLNSATFSGNVGISNANAGIEMGPNGTSNTPFIDFHSSANLLDFDSRIMASGGASTSGQGTLTFYASNIVITGAEAHTDQKLSGAMLVDCGLTQVDKGNSGTTAQVLDYAAGSVQKITVTGAFTLSVTNWPPSGNLGIMQIELVNGGSFAITWPTVNWIKPDGTTTTSFSTWLAASTGRIALQSAGIDKIKLETTDSGAVVYGRFA